MRIALSFGFYDVDRFLERISKRQLLEWVAFFNIEPWSLGEAMIASTVANIQLMFSKGGKAKTPNDFMPFSYIEKKEQSGEELKAKFERMFPVEKVKRKNGRN